MMFYNRKKSQGYKKYLCPCGQGLNVNVVKPKPPLTVPEVLNATLLSGFAMRHPIDDFVIELQTATW